MILADLYDWLLVAHILAAMTWVGGALALSVVATVALRAADDRAVGRFVEALAVVGPRIMAPAPGILLLLGIAMVADSDAWSFGQAWVIIAFGLFALAFVFGAAFQSRSAIGAGRAAGEGDLAEARRQLAQWTLGSRLILLVLVVVTWDMVFKPGL